MELLFTSSFIICHSSALMHEGYGKSPCVSVCLSVCVRIKPSIEQLRKTKHTNGVSIARVNHNVGLFLKQPRRKVAEFTLMLPYPAHSVFTVRACSTLRQSGGVDLNHVVFFSWIWSFPSSPVFTVLQHTLSMCNQICLYSTLLSRC